MGLVISAIVVPRTAPSRLSFGSITFPPRFFDGSDQSTWECCGRTSWVNQDLTSKHLRAAARAVKGALDSLGQCRRGEQHRRQISEREAFDAIRTIRVR